MRHFALALLCLTSRLAALDYAGGALEQNFDSLAGPDNNSAGHAWTNGTTLPGWHASVATYTVTDATYDGSASAFSATNVAAHVGLLDFGAAGATDRALGLRATGSISGRNPMLLGVELTNTGESTFLAFTVSFAGEQWFQADTNLAHSLFVEYKIGAAGLGDATGWTDIPAARFNGPRFGPAAAALDGNDPANRRAISATVSGLAWVPGQKLWIRFRDANESGNEHGLAVDDFVFEASTQAGPASVAIGPWSGNIGPASATVSAAVNRAGVSVRAVASTHPDFSSPIHSAPVMSDNPNGNAVRLELTGLTADTEYHYALELDGVLVTASDKTGRFRTFPAPGPASFRIGFGACGHWSSGNQFVYEAAAAEDIRLFIVTGDLQYADTNSSDPALYRANYRDALSIGSQGGLLRRHASAYVWDDHDFSGDNSSRLSTGRGAHRQVYRELVPHYPLPAAPDSGDAHGGIQHAFTLGRVRFVMTDLRSYRDSTSIADDANKTMMGAEQKAWFKQQLIAARDAEAPLIVWVSSVPFISLETSGDNWGRYRTERTELLEFIRNERIQNVVILSGDMHGLAADDGSGTESYVSGVRIPVFHAASFNRPGSVKGGPYSHGTSAGDRRYGLFIVNDDGVAPVTATYEGKIASSATVSTLWARLTHTTEPVRPLAPAGFAATPDADGIALTWTDRSSVETGFRVERAADASGPWAALATPAANATSYHDATAEPGLGYYYRIVATNGAVESAPGAAVTARALTRMQRWKLRTFGDAEVPDTDDRDGDGRPALLEYALGGDPLAPDQAPGFAAKIERSEGKDFLAVSFTRHPERSDLRYLVHAGSDLAAWDELARSENGAPLAGAGTVTGDGPGTEPRVVSVRDVVPVADAGGRRFLRVSAQP